MIPPLDRSCRGLHDVRGVFSRLVHPSKYSPPTRRGSSLRQPGLRSCARIGNNRSAGAASLFDLCGTRIRQENTGMFRDIFLENGTLQAKKKMYSSTID